ncbi:hypothetical protein AB0I28_04550 [Phytomonospora sp. NPDC050363]|uniref:hypothetical protein n=1 Tax=Phytomonospora sp. NPDC050363 TaxID=3155642 RepID=UPI0033EF3586
MITSTTLYRRRSMHRQRDLDSHYLIPSAALIAFALATAENPAPTTLLTSTLYIPLLSFWASWNDTRQLAAGRVEIWRDVKWWTHNFPITVPLVPVGKLTLAFAALPAFTSTAIAVGWVDHLLWTVAASTLLATLVYTVLGIALAATSHKAVTVGIAYVLGIELVGVVYIDALAWLSPTAWVHSIVLADPPLPTVAAWTLLACFLALVVFLGSVAVIFPHRYRYSRFRRKLADLGWGEEDAS